MAFKKYIKSATGILIFLTLVNTIILSVIYLYITKNSATNVFYNFNSNYILSSKETLEFKKITWQDGRIRISYLLQETLFSDEFCTAPSWIDLHKIYEPHLNWKASKNDYVHETRTNYSKIEVYLSPPGCTSRLKITTRNQLGEWKQTGGDWWRVIIENSDVSLAVQMKDRNNGSYTGIFILQEPGNYSLLITLETTQWEGIMDPPDWWYKNGTVHGSLQTEGILEEVHHFHNEPIPVIWFTAETVAKQTKCSMRTCSNQKVQNLCNSPYGYWYKGEYKSYTPQVRANNFNSRIMKPLNTLLIYGDSIAKMFSISIQKHEICKKIFKSCLIVYTQIYTVGYMQWGKFDNLDFNENRFLSEIRNIFKQKDLRTNKSTLVINFGLHIVQKLPLKRSMKLFQMFLDLIKDVKSELRQNCPIIIWKETTPPMIERTDKWNITQYRFLTKQRVAFWNTFTQQELRHHQIDIPILYVHNMASSYPNKSMDHVHFVFETFLSAENSLYEFANDMLKR